MRRFMFLLILIMLLTGTVSTEAANWVKLGEGTFGPHYIDTSSITAGPDGSKEAWIKIEYQPADCTSSYSKSVGKCISSMLSYERFYPNKTSCSTQILAYFTDGANSGSSPYSCSPAKIPPETIRETRWSYLFR